MTDIEFSETVPLMQGGDARRSGANAISVEDVAQQMAAEMERLLATIEDPEERRLKRLEIVEDIDALMAHMRGEG